MVLKLRLRGPVRESLALMGHVLVLVPAWFVAFAWVATTIWAITTGAPHDGWIFYGNINRASEGIPETIAMVLVAVLATWSAAKYVNSYRKVWR